MKILQLPYIKHDITLYKTFILKSYNIIECITTLNPLETAKTLLILSEIKEGNIKVLFKRKKNIHCNNIVIFYLLKFKNHDNKFCDYFKTFHYVTEIYSNANFEKIEINFKNIFILYMNCYYTIH